MAYTRSALGLLSRQYRSVLKKCFLINIGLFALGATAVQAATIEPTRGADASFEYTEGSADDYTFKVTEDGETKYYKVNLLPEKFSTSDKIVWAKSSKTVASDVEWNDQTNTATGTVEVQLPHNDDRKKTANF